MTEQNQKPNLSMEQLQSLMAKQKPVVSKKQAFMQKAVTSIMHKMQSLLHLLDRFVNFITKKTDKNRSDVVQTARSPILFGTYTIIIFAIFGGLWSTIAPLNSAAVAVGILKSSTEKKIIQHHEGGVIKDIFVKVGDHVKNGDKLIELEDVRVKSQYEATLNQYRTSLATENRLIAERDNLDEIEFDDFLKKDANDSSVAKIMRTQENLFYKKRAVYKAEKDSLQQRIAQENKQIESLQSKKISLKKNLEFIADRAAAAKTLSEKGFIKKENLAELEAKEAEAKSNIAGTDIEIARHRQEITRFDIENLNIENKVSSDSLRELREAQEKTSSLKENFVAHSDNLNKIVIKSPIDGIINALFYHTIGGVVQPGREVLEISPLNDQLVIEARIPAKNINAVHVGLKAKVRFSAFKSRTTPVFTGTLVSLSPDIVQDRSGNQQQQESYYIGRVEIDMEAFNKVAKAKKLVLLPGMQAEIQIVTGTRTLFRYLLDPLTDTMFHGFNEK